MTLSQFTGNLLTNVLSDINTSPAYKPGAIDAFGRLRVSQPYTLFDSKLLEDARPLFWDDAQTSGSGTTSTHSVAKASVAMAVSANTAGTRVRQTKQRFNYQPGKSQLMLLTANMGAGLAGITRRVGLFYADNGLFFELADTTLSVVVRSSASGSPVDTVIAQSGWNIDKFDGTGISGLTVDTQYSQIFAIDFEWLAVGAVRFGFTFNNIFYPAHIVFNYNTLTAANPVYMSTPNLPARYEISNDGTGAAAELIHICTSVMSEGGQEPTGFVHGIVRATEFDAGNDANVYPLISMRLKSTHLGATVDILDFSVISESDADLMLYLLLNPTVAGVDAASWVGVTGSAVEYDITRDATNTLTEGTILHAVTAVAGGSTFSLPPVSITNALRLGATIAGVRDQIVLAAQRVTGAAEDYYAAMNVRVRL